jgi:hypothetical protein
MNMKCITMHFLDSKARVVLVSINFLAVLVSGFSDMFVRLAATQLNVRFLK